MEKLGLIDQIFYKADQYGLAKLVMGGASILEPARPGGRLDSSKIADHIAARLEKNPLLRRKFTQDPLRLGSVKKVEDPRFNIHEHIVTGSLEAPGGYPELVAALGRICSRPVDPSELWRFTLLDGLQGGRLAMVIQMHHALFDGLGAGQAIASLYDSKPVRLEKPTGETAPPPEEPGTYALLGDALVETSRRLLISTPRFVRDNTLPLVKVLADGVRELISNGPGALQMPEMNPTSLNTGASSGTRTVAYLPLDLPEIKALAKRHSVSVNDLALLMFSYAMEFYFRENGERVEFDLWCGMPISTRSENSSAGNQVSGGRINLHNTISDPLERLRAIHTDTVESKQAARPESPALDTQALGELLPPLALEGLVLTFRALGLFERLGRNFPVMNAVLSNVPGPRETMYLGNSRVAESIPLVPPIEVLAVSGGVTSVSNTITLGFNCDAAVVQNAELLVKGADYGLAALRKAGEKIDRGRSHAGRKAQLSPRKRGKSAKSKKLST